jgi:hypothetical protein
MKRRDILKYTALATGAAVSAPLLSSLLVGCRSEITESGAAETLHFFSRDEMALVKDLVDLILPKTDSPSASEVGVHRMIDAMVGTVYAEKDRALYKKGFAALASYLKEAAAGKEFVSLAADVKLPVLQQLDRSGDASASAPRQALLDFKQQTVAYYLATEEIGKNYLNYLPIPGAYNACIQLSEVEGGRAWAE